MKFRITRPLLPVDTEVHLPASKSISNRLLIIHAFSGGRELPGNLSDSDDTRVMTEALRSPGNTVDVGHAGTSMRFLTAFFSSRPGSVLLTGSNRMKERPIGPLVDALRQLGADIRYAGKEGFPPLQINGKELDGGEVSISGSISSQFISALLMTGPVMKKGLTLHLEGTVVSESYIKLTLQLMKACGASWSVRENRYTVLPGNYRTGNMRVESDWSAASYWYMMGYLSRYARIRLTGLEQASLQGDSALVNIFHGLGLFSTFEGEAVRLKWMATIHPAVFEYDFTNAPDIVQTMAVGLCMAGVRYRFSGTRTLRIKETDRITALQRELRKLGYLLETDAQGDTLAWNGATCEPESDPVIETYHDHRMAMAFVPVALVRGSVVINEPMVVTKSYPRFWDDLQKAGFRVE